MAEDLKKLTEQMYGASLAGQKASIDSNYQKNLSDMNAAQQIGQQKTTANLNAAYSDAARSAKNYNEVQNAYGLSSGAMAQARLSQENNLNNNLNSIRTAQQMADSETERQKNLLAQQYSAAISKAQADNDMQKAQQLFQLAQQEEERLRNDKLNAAQMLAGVGDYSLYQSLYGLTPEQVALLQAKYSRDNTPVYYGRSNSSGSSNDKNDISALLGDKEADATKSRLEESVKRVVDYINAGKLGESVYPSYPYDPSKDPRNKSNTYNTQYGTVKK